ncbi:hypothetical protein CKM354_001127900 [Cercospora kikuchii]|uniref:Uncharacterized protein n=1 Tax=Cercospora kikuchii TaxID=84275 RepID=A0A9P3FKZ4_9PEZI|nr:uncharacterized protein CKM354_001127900 [Cercospora kikuchii]GIZ48209.1 hypothetical protein CKM354_001127900 [Cercospora kikuchii]
MMAATDVILSELESHFEGYARMSLSSLEYGSARPIDERNVERLEAIFENGCDRTTPAHSVPVLVDQYLLHQMLLDADLNHSDLTLRSPPVLHLPPGPRLTCLHGRHRLLAAEEVFPASDQWWTVQFYRSSLSEAARKFLTEQTDNSQGYSDGDIFFHYRSHVKEKNFSAADRWLLRLSGSKYTNLRQLERSHRGTLIEAFDELLPFRALWADFSLGAFNQILPTRCFEEIQTYASAIKHTWTDILRTDLEPAQLDRDTVESFQLLCPKGCKDDAEKVSSLMDDRSIFQATKNQIVRRDLRSRLLQCPRILSLYSFHQDILFLEAGYNALKQLIIVPRQPRSHVQGQKGRKRGHAGHLRKSQAQQDFRSALEQHFFHERKFFSANYMELWMHALREYPDLAETRSNEPPKDDHLPHKKGARRDSARVGALALRAHNLGFQSTQISTLLASCPDRPVLDRPSARLPQLSSDWGDDRKLSRCNRPSRWVLARTRQYLFPKLVYQSRADAVMAQITPTYILYDIVRCFWSRIPPEHLEDPQRVKHGRISETLANPPSPIPVSHVLEGELPRSVHEAGPDAGPRQQALGAEHVGSDVQSSDVGHTANTPSGTRNTDAQGRNLRKSPEVQKSKKTTSRGDPRKASRKERRVTKGRVTKGDATKMLASRLKSRGSVAQYLLNRRRTQWPRDMSSQPGQFMDGALQDAPSNAHGEEHERRPQLERQPVQQEEGAQDSEYRRRSHDHDTSSYDETNDDLDAIIGDRGDRDEEDAERIRSEAAQVSEALGENDSQRRQTFERQHGTELLRRMPALTAFRPDQRDFVRR